MPRLVPVSQRLALGILARTQLGPSTGFFLAVTVSPGDVVIPVWPQLFAHRLGGACRHCQRFVAWLKANPAYLKDKAPDAITRYLVETYPCKAPEKAAKSGGKKK